MNKDKKNILILFFIVIVIVLTSYFLFASGTTNKIRASINKMSADINKEENASFYPVITMVVNSSGENLVNEDVALTVIAESEYKIDKIYYSYDMEKWYDDAYEAEYGKNANIRLVFDENMNNVVYIKVENEMGYQSYVYETKVNIDKKKPVISINKNENEVVILATDNYGLSSVQYSTDGINWATEETSGKNVSIKKNDFNYVYVRVVDMAGNISSTKEIG